MDPHAHESLEGEAEGTASSSSLPSSRTHANLSATISRPAPPGGRRPAHRTTSGAFSGPRPTSAAGREPRPGRAETGLGAERREMGTTSPSLDANRSPVPAVVEIPKEEIEKALEGLSRDDLVMALGRAKVQMDQVGARCGYWCTLPRGHGWLCLLLSLTRTIADLSLPVTPLQLDAKLETQTLSLESLHVFASDVASKLSLSEAEVESLTVAISQREERVDELLREQERMEDEVYARMEVVERLRKQLDESQKSKAEAERRYHDQVSSRLTGFAHWREHPMWAFLRRPVENIHGGEPKICGHESEAVCCCSALLVARTQKWTLLSDALSGSDQNLDGNNLLTYLG